MVQTAVLVAAGLVLLVVIGFGAYRFTSGTDSSVGTLDSAPDADDGPGALAAAAAAEDDGNADSDEDRVGGDT